MQITLEQLRANGDLTPPIDQPLSGAAEFSDQEKIALSNLMTSDFIRYILQQSAQFAAQHPNQVHQIPHRAGLHATPATLLQRGNEFHCIAFETDVQINKRRDPVREELAANGLTRPLDEQRLLDDLQAQVNHIRTRAKYQLRIEPTGDLILYYPLVHSDLMLDQDALNQNTVRGAYNPLHHSALIARYNFDTRELIRLDHVDSSADDTYHAPFANALSTLGVELNRMPCEIQAGHLCAEHTAFNIVCSYLFGPLPTLTNALTEQERAQLAQLRGLTDDRRRQLIATIIRPRIAQAIQDGTLMPLMQRFIEPPVHPQQAPRLQNYSDAKWRSTMKANDTALIEHSYAEEEIPPLLKHRFSQFRSTDVQLVIPDQVYEAVDESGKLLTSQERYEGTGLLTLWGYLAQQESQAISDEKKLYVLPLSHAGAHWRGMVVAKNLTKPGAVDAFFIDSDPPERAEDREVGRAYVEHVAKVFPNADFHYVLHYLQDDSRACGPLMIENLAAVVEHILTNQPIAPQKLSAEQVLLIRQQHAKAMPAVGLDHFNHGAYQKLQDPAPYLAKVPDMLTYVHAAEATDQPILNQPIQLNFDTIQETETGQIKFYITLDNPPTGEARERLREALERAQFEVYFEPNYKELQQIRLFINKKPEYEIQHGTFPGHTCLEGYTAIKQLLEQNRLGFREDLPALRRQLANIQQQLAHTYQHFGGYQNAQATFSDFDQLNENIQQQDRRNKGKEEEPAAPQPQRATTRTATQPNRTTAQPGNTAQQPIPKPPASQPRPASQAARPQVQLFERSFTRATLDAINRMQGEKFKKHGRKHSYWPSSYTKHWKAEKSVTENVIKLCTDYKSKRTRRGHINRKQSDLAVDLITFCAQQPKPTDQQVLQKLMQVRQKLVNKSSSQTGSFYRRLHFMLHRVATDKGLDLAQTPKL